MDFRDLNKELGNADLLLIDQILKGRFHQKMRILDAGCGEGRNMVYFIRNGFPIYGIDENPEMVSMAKMISRSIDKKFIVENIFTSSIEQNPFPDEFFDVVLCINVMHFAKNTDHFMRLIISQMRILRKGGLFYIGMESLLNIGNKKEKESLLRNNMTDDGNKFFLTSKLLENLLSMNILKKDEPIRTIYGEGMIGQTGLWIRKI